MKELITICVGQCGNQIGQDFWRRLCQEHGIGLDGTPTADPMAAEAPGAPASALGVGACERKEVFFYMDDDNHYVPRSVFIDLEPTIVNRFTTPGSEFSALFNRENCFAATSSGAANNWAVGYCSGSDPAIREELFDILDREVDNCDNLEGFLLCHSTAGGTGSGLGSFLLEQISDRYPKKIKQSYSVFPDAQHSSEVVIQPYNVVLTLEKLAKFADSVVVIDNTAINRIVTDDTLRNYVVGTMMAATTSTIRFPGTTNTDLVSILSGLIPTPRCHFLSTTYTPLTVERANGEAPVAAAVRRSSVVDIMRRLLQPKNSFVSTFSTGGKYISLLNIIRGDVDPLDVHNGLLRIKERSLIDFIPWAHSSMQVVTTVNSPHMPNSRKLRGLMLANHTSFSALLSKSFNDFRALWNKGVYLESFRKTPLFSDSLDGFAESAEYVKSLIEEYQVAETPEYPSWTPSR